jgi:hypothetical protein
MKAAIGIACVGLVFWGCAADPELANYTGGGRARSRSDRQVAKVVGGAAAVAGAVGLAAATGGEIT